MIAADWWRGLQPALQHPDLSRRTGDRAALARLRRCTRIEQSGGESAALELARAIGITHGTDPGLPGALLAACVLAHVREDRRDVSLGRSLGATGEAKAVLSPLRLTRLLSAETEEEQLVSFRRLVALLGGRANVPDLAKLLLHWTERNRIELVFDYHNASVAAAPPPSVIPAGEPA